MFFICTDEVSTIFNLSNNGYNKNQIFWQVSKPFCCESKIVAKLKGRCFVVLCFNKHKNIANRVTQKFLLTVQKLRNLRVKDEKKRSEYFC